MDQNSQPTPNQFCFCRNLPNREPRNIIDDFYAFVATRWFYREAGGVPNKPARKLTNPVHTKKNTKQKSAPVSSRSTDAEEGESVSQQNWNDFVSVMSQLDLSVEIPMNGFEQVGQLSSQLRYRVRCNIFTSDVLQVSVVDEKNPSIYFVTNEWSAGNWDDPCNLLRILETRIGTTHSKSKVPEEPCLVHLGIEEMDVSSVSPIRHIACSLDYSDESMGKKVGVKLHVRMVPNKWNIDE
jgi:hypothetical protein